MIEFHLDGRSGVSPYQQIVQQVRNALRLGLLREGDQLPTVKDVVGALADCDLEVPAGHVVGLVGPNGAGKSTLLNLAVGMITPTAGSVEVLGTPAGTRQAKVGYVAQDTPTYARLSVAEHLKLGARLN